MSTEEFEDEDLGEELSFKEQDSLNKLSPEEMIKFSRSIELYIDDPTSSKNIWFLTDNLIEFADNLIHLKKNWPEGFDKILLKNKGLLEDACNVPDVDKTIKILMQESIEKIKDCLRRMTDAGYFIVKNKDSTEEPSTYEKYKYPYYKYKNRPVETPVDKATKVLSKRFAHHLLHRYDPHYEDNETSEELASMNDRIALEQEGIIHIPIEQQYDPKTTAYLTSGIEKLRERSLEYQKQKQKLSELSNKKVELANQKDNLKLFREQLLMKCIDQMIVSAKE